MKWTIFLIVVLLVGCTETIIVEKNITIEVEKIVTPDCPVCEVFEPSDIISDVNDTIFECEVCENCTPCDNQKYILRLIREAKKCEKSQYYTNLSICVDDYNRTSKELDECSLYLCRYNNSWCNR